MKNYFLLIQVAVIAIDFVIISYYDSGSDQYLNVTKGKLDRCMEIKISNDDSVIIIALDGEIDGRTAPAIQEQLTPLVTPGCKILLNMQGVSYMSSGGLRLMLLFYRKITNHHGRVVLVGLSEMVRDTMAITGFLDFFETYDTVDEGLTILNRGD